jgi:hypothetical protein
MSTSVKILLVAKVCALVRLHTFSWMMGALVDSVLSWVAVTAISLYSCSAGLFA